MRKPAARGWGGARPGSGPKGGPSKVVRLPLAIADMVHGLANGRFRPGVIAELRSVEARTAAGVPVMASRAACGFPSPADDYLEGKLDFNEYLIKNEPATFIAYVTGDSMTGAGIFDGDMIVVDRSMTPSNGCIVLACIDNEFTLKRYMLKRGQVVLQAENPKFRDIIIAEESTLEVVGVVKHSIRML